MKQNETWKDHHKKNLCIVLLYAALAPQLKYYFSEISALIQLGHIVTPYLKSKTEKIILKLKHTDLTQVAESGLYD